MGVYVRERGIPRYLFATTHVMSTGKLIRESARRVLIVKWSRRLPPPSVHQNSRLQEGGQVFILKYVACTNNLADSCQGMVAPFLLSRFPDARQGSPLQAACSKESNLSLLCYHVMSLCLALLVHTSRSVLHHASQ